MHRVGACLPGLPLSGGYLSQLMPGQAVAVFSAVAYLPPPRPLNWLINERFKHPTLVLQVNYVHTTMQSLCRCHLCITGSTTSRLVTLCIGTLLGALCATSPRAGILCCLHIYLSPA
jgi:hypothetical protein